jgi:hypothetical protein
MPPLAAGLKKPMERMKIPPLEESKKKNHGFSDGANKVVVIVKSAKEVRVAAPSKPA